MGAATPDRCWWRPDWQDLVPTDPDLGSGRLVVPNPWGDECMNLLTRGEFNVMALRALATLLLGGGVLTIPGENAFWSSPPGKLTLHEVSLLRSAILDLSSGYRHMPPEPLQAQVTALVGRLYHLATQRSQDADVRRELLSCLAMTGVLGGHLGLVTGTRGDAMAWFQHAAEVAAVAGDGEWHAAAMLGMADLTSTVPTGTIPDRARDLIALAQLQAAETTLGAGSNRPLMAWILLRQAEQQAVLGRPDAACARVDEADRVFAVHHLNPGGMYRNWDQPLHDQWRGKIDLLANLVMHARAQLEHALRASPPGGQRRVPLLVDYGSCLALLGEVDGACDALTAAVEGSRHHGQPDRLAQIHNARARFLTPHEREPRVRDLDALLMTD